MSVQANKVLAAKFLMAFSSSAQDVLNCLDDDVTWWVSGSLPGISGSYSKQDMTGFLTPMDEFYKPGTLRVTPSSMIGENDSVAVEAVSYAELPDGRTYRNSYHFLLRFRGDKLILVKEYMDSHHAWEIFCKD